MAPWWEIIAVYYCAIACISLYSYLFKPLPTFDFVEGVTIGCAAANTFIAYIPRMIDYLNIAMGTKLLPGGFPPYFALFPVILGVFLNFIITRWRWLAYYPSSILLGIGLGLAISRGIEGQIWAQLRDNILLSFTSATTLLSWIDAFVIAIGTFTALAYFLYSREQKGTWGTVTRIGRLFMMASLGLSWATYLVDKLDSNTAIVDVIVNQTRRVLGLL